MGTGAILYLDGLGWNPIGVKPTFLRSLGYVVECPQLSDFLFTKACIEAQQAVDAIHPSIIVGYSRGGALAVLVQAAGIPRVLVAPAVGLLGAEDRLQQRCLVLHSSGDDAIPLTDVREFIERSQLPADTLRVCGADHTMIDPAALDALQQAVLTFVPPPVLPVSSRPPR
jgi:hypothetical protein